MKKTIFTLALLAATCLTANATVRTVSNYNGSGQYSDLGSAYSASATGDTIILHGSPYAYYWSACSYWSKNLVVYGTGFNPQKQTTWHSIIAGDGCNNWNSFWFGSNGNGSRFYGIEFANNTGADPGQYSGSDIANYTFEDCKFNSYFVFGKSANQVVFRNCIFDRDNNTNIELSNWQFLNSNILFSNCVFDGRIDGNPTNGSHTVTFDHCLFLATTVTPFANFYNNTIKNSIFMNTTSIGSVSNITYLNNIARLFSIGVASNLNNTNPNFVSYSLGSLYSTAHNYNLQAASPAINAGSDGTDIGVNGGLTKFNEAGEVLIAPVVRTLNISNSTIAPNGSLNIQINASKPNDY